MEASLELDIVALGAARIHGTTEAFHHELVQGQQFGTRRQKSQLLSLKCIVWDCVALSF